MPNYDHDKLFARIAEIGRSPDDNTAFTKWLTAQAHLELLRQNATDDELIIYASGEHTFIHAVAVSHDALADPDVNDLLQWSGNPYSFAASYVSGGDGNDVRIEPGRAVNGSRALSGARLLVFARQINGLPGQTRTYFEVVQEYSHLTNIHHYPERHSYCRFDDQGDMEQLVTITGEAADNDVTVVTFKRGPLDEYLAASRSVLVRMFEFTLMRRSEDFSSLRDTPEKVVEQSPIFYRQRIAGSAAYARGVQIIHPSPRSATTVSAMERQRLGHERYVDFWAYDWRNKKVTMISTDPRATTNYFQASENSLPFELSPAFFDPEVLAKYKNDTDKYAIEARSIHCRAAWTLSGYDTNEAGQVHVYICDLRSLPYAEQLYWKSFNQPPKTGISERAWKTDFCGEFVDLVDPLEQVKRVLRAWEKKRTPWWTLRDATSMLRTATPRTGSVDEWAQELKNVAVLVIEGFQIEGIRRRLDEMGLQWNRNEKSLSLLERVLSHGPSSGDDHRLHGLRSVQRIRSKIGSHARGAEAATIVAGAIREHGTYTAHFEELCLTVERELKCIGRAFGAAGEESTQTDSPRGEEEDASV
ncbi:MAG: hypothetical protein OXB98_00015 [Bryobacterales bacterium]|nr:hypothetical protein [Bryobacterales bacterium]